VKASVAAPMGQRLSEQNLGINKPPVNRFKCVLLIMKHLHEMWTTVNVNWINEPVVRWSMPGIVKLEEVKTFEFGKMNPLNPRTTRR
jgi:hypothetical protein